MAKTIRNKQHKQVKLTWKISKFCIKNEENWRKNGLILLKIWKNIGKSEEK